MKFFRELKSYIFYGKKEGIICNKKPYMFLTGKHVALDKKLTVMTLFKKVHFLGRERDIFTDVVVSDNEASRFNVGDYYEYGEI